MARVGRDASLTDDKKIDLALRRFAPMFDGNPPIDYSELAKDVGVSTKTVQRAIAEVFANRWVDIRKMSPGYRRRTDLEEKLLKRFSNKGKLETAIVVSHPDRGPDFAHECLGTALADEIITRKMFRDRDRIALGTGRGVHFVAEALFKRREQLRRREEVLLVSLTGRIFPVITAVDPTDSKYNFSDNLADADTNVFMMARVFDHVAGLRPVMHPIAHENANRNKLLNDGELGHKRFDDHIPNHAIVGFGVLDHDHRLFREVSLSNRYDTRSEDGTGRNLDLSRVKRDVEQLVEWSEKYKEATGFQAPVGDICNRFFLINRKCAATARIEEIMLKLRTHVDSLKSSLLTATKTQLGMIPNLMVIGAGPEKAHILHFLLSGTTPARPHIVVTDAQCAEKMLEMDDDIYTAS